MIQVFVLIMIRQDQNKIGVRYGTLQFHTSGVFHMGIINFNRNSFIFQNINNGNSRRLAHIVYITFIAHAKGCNFGRYNTLQKHLNLIRHILRHTAVGLSG